MMNGVSEVIAQLVNDLADLFMVFAGAGFSHEPFESCTVRERCPQDLTSLLKGALLPFIIELVC